MDILKGNFAGNSNPIHPALVHLPLVLFPLSATLRYIGTNANAISMLPGIDDRTAFTGAHYINALALLTAVPTAITGFMEYQNMRKENKAANSTVQKHMLLNTVVTLIGLYNWYSIRNKQGFVPEFVNVALGLLAACLLFYSGHLGGKLVYQYGVGVQRQGDALIEKNVLPDADEDLDY